MFDGSEVSAGGDRWIVPAGYRRPHLGNDANQVPFAPVARLRVNHNRAYMRGHAGVVEAEVEVEAERVRVEVEAAPGALAGAAGVSLRGGGRRRFYLPVTPAASGTIGYRLRVELEGGPHDGRRLESAGLLLHVYEPDAGGGSVSIHVDNSVQAGRDAMGTSVRAAETRLDDRVAAALRRGLSVNDLLGRQFPDDWAAVELDEVPPASEPKWDSAVAEPADANDRSLAQDTGDGFREGANRPRPDGPPPPRRWWAAVAMTVLLVALGLHVALVALSAACHFVLGATETADGLLWAAVIPLTLTPLAALTAVICCWAARRYDHLSVAAAYLPVAALSATIAFAGSSDGSLLCGMCFAVAYTAVLSLGVLDSWANLHEGGAPAINDRQT